ncbi:pentatricopeptide repeat-containing protein At2g02750-like [Arachis hypogaea]|uniref:pentatricopeptide repeat-containing protein At2g02750-like n=1 Tax=Arachis hypogaea TaxID=3818 RepID=UPI003B226DF5
MSIFSKSISNNTLCLHHPSAAYALKVMFLPDALKVFKEMPQRNVVCFNAVLSGLSQNGLPGKALKVHCLAVEFYVYVATSLVTVYSNCGDVSASEVFKEMPLKSVVSYNVFVSRLLQNGIPHLVLDVFKDMIMVGFLEVKPNSVTLVSARFACATLLYACFGRQVHGLALKFASYDEVILVTALVDMYSKCGCRHAAFNVFNAAEGNNRNLIT